MSETAPHLEELRQTLEREGVDAALARLCEQLRQAGRYHELFEALKMRSRFRLGLPLSYGESGDELDQETRDELEDALLDACREVGTALLRKGAIREGWMYLRPVGDRQLSLEELRGIDANENNLDELIEVALHEGVDPARGFELILDHHGTCNAITTYESVVVRQGKAAQQAAAAMLVEHVHQELLATVRADIARQQGKEPAADTLLELVADRDWLFGEHSYHLDTTHLASTVRAAKVLEDPAMLRRALDLTEYGRRLSPTFQYKGDEPFADIYPAHGLFFQALLGENVDEAISFFQTKAESLDPAEHGSLPVETYVELLDRLGRYDAAIGVLTGFAERQPNAAAQVVPLMLDLSQRGGDYERLVAFCQQRGDLLGFASALMHQAIAGR